MKIAEIQDTEYNVYYGKYTGKLKAETELREGFKSGSANTLHFFNAVPEDKLDYRYAPEKWNIKEVFQHLIDTERIFIYRCFRIARNDQTNLSGFNQDDYIPSRASAKSLEALSEEYKATRHSSISLLDNLSDEDLRCVGNVSGAAMSARAAAAIIIGHEIWHAELIKERYL